MRTISENLQIIKDATDAVKSALVANNIEVENLIQWPNIFKSLEIKIKPKDYLKFTAEADNSTIVLNSVSNPDIKYSLNDGEWTQWDYSAITLNTGDTVRMKGNNSNGFSFSTSSYNRFKMTGKIGASGNIMSLLYEDDFEGKLTIPCDYCFNNLFRNCTALTTAPELPATTLTNGCYFSMFLYCTSLTTAPELPATTLTENCYERMLRHCTSLTTAPELPSTTLAYSCYNNMFAECASLTTAPKLPATTLDSYCYCAMFMDCTSLTTGPELPATTLYPDCYLNMFNGCTKLNYIKMLATDINVYECLDCWVDGVPSGGTFVKHPDMTSLPWGTDGIPYGWTVEDAVIS